MDDPRLLAIAAAAERGETVLPMGMLAGGWLVQGTPVSYARFYEQTSHNVAKQLHAAMPAAERKRWQGRDAELWGDLSPRIARAMSSLGDPSVLDVVALNIAPARAVVNDTTLHIPALRVAVSSISTWWVTDFLTQKESPTSIGIGVVVPFN